MCRSALKHKPEHEGCVDNVIDMPQCVYLKDLKRITGEITHKSSETLENVDEDKEQEDIEDNCSDITRTQTVAALEESASHLSKDNSIIDTQ